MAQGLARVKHRIQTVEATRKITNSMKLVSSVKLRKMSNLASSQDAYFEAMQHVLNDAIFSNRINPEAHYETPLVEVNKNATKRLLIILTSNMGLCGGYNNNILKFYKDIYEKNDEVIIIGQKGYANLKKEKNLSLNNKYVDLSNRFSLTKTKRLVGKLIEKYLTGEYKEISLIYTKYRNSISFVPNKLVILPLPVVENKANNYSPIYEPNKQEVLDTIIPLYLDTLVYASFYSAFISEESSRRNAMDTADKNAQDLVEKLKLEYNKARQQEITQEITEVVNGSMAVK